MIANAENRYPASMLKQHEANLSWICKLTDRICDIDCLTQLIEKHIPSIVGHALQNVTIDLDQYNVKQNIKYGRTISLELIKSHWSLAKLGRCTLANGFYSSADQSKGLIVQGDRCIGIVLTKTMHFYNEVVQMGDMVICRGDKASSMDRKALSFDGNYRTQRILNDKFGDGVPRLSMAVLQCIHRYCTTGTEINVVHTEGHIICDGKVRHKRERALLNLVKDICGNDKVVKNIHLPLMEGLEFDIWIPERRIAIEFQGQQHRNEVELWGGKVGLEQRKARDRRKRLLAKKNGIKLIEVWFDDEYDRETIATLLAMA